MRRILILVLVAVVFLPPASCAYAPAGPVGRAPAPDPDPAPAPAGDRANIPRRRPATSGQGLRAPMFWTWQEPLGAAASHPQVIRMVRVKVEVGPETAANNVCRDITRRGLGPGQVCILLQNFGMGDGDSTKAISASPALFKHWDDGVTRGSVPSWWLTVWSKHGIAECGAWTDRFITRYKANQARDARIPDPSRFHFDSEGSILPHLRPKTAVAVFDAMRKDPRWSTEIVPGNRGKTMERLYAAAGSPSYDLRRFATAPVNRAWVTWYGGVANQAAEGAMDEVAYQPIRRAWRQCLSSNYATSARFDGKGSPPRFRWAPRNPKLGVASDGFGDLQAPVLYWAMPETVRHLEGSLEDTTLQRAETIIDANRMSFGGPHRDIVPWLLMIGYTGDVRGRSLEVSKALTKRMLRMLKEKGVQEFIMWSDKSSQDSPRNWNELVELIEEVWR